MERELGRSLNQFEQDICDYPRVCIVSGATENLKNCRDCFCVAFSLDCAEEAKKRHNEFCTPLKYAAEDYRLGTVELCLVCFATSVVLPKNSGARTVRKEENPYFADTK